MNLCNLQKHQSSDDKTSYLVGEKNKKQKTKTPGEKCPIF